MVKTRLALWNKSISIQGVVGKSRIQVLVAYRGERRCPSVGPSGSGRETKMAYFLTSRLILTFHVSRGHSVATAVARLDVTKAVQYFMLVSA